MDLCACKSEEREHEVGADVNAFVLSHVLFGIGLAGSASPALPCFAKRQNKKEELK